MAWSDDTYALLGIPEDLVVRTSPAHLLTRALEMELPWFQGLGLQMKTWSLCSSTQQGYMVLVVSSQKVAGV